VALAYPGACLAWGDLRALPFQEEALASFGEGPWGAAHKEEACHAEEGREVVALVWNREGLHTAVDLVPEARTSSAPGDACQEEDRPEDLALGEDHTGRVEGREGALRESERLGRDCRSLDLRTLAALEPSVASFREPGLPLPARALPDLVELGSRARWEYLVLQLVPLLVLLLRLLLL
jgi:hypothetical protein